MSKRRVQKQKRTPLSPRNITEHAMEQCRKIKDRNRSLRSTVLRTPKDILATVVYIPTKITGLKVLRGNTISFLRV